MPENTCPDTPPVLPQHVAIIMDGNGRWARARGMPRKFGHRQGAENVTKITRTAVEMGIRYLTLYAFSAENWNRPADEVDTLMKLLIKFLRSQEKELMKMNLRLRTIGDIASMPDDVQKQIRETSDRSRNNGNGSLILALNYGSRQEIVTAARKLAEKAAGGALAPESVTWETLAGELYTADIPDPDLVIRTSGEKRISNFLLLQSAYAEFYFSEKNWPEFGPRDFREAIDDFAHRQRRFGRTGEQVSAVPEGTEANLQR